jgi:hypothetical protein
LIPVVSGISAFKLFGVYFPMISTPFILSCCLLVATTLFASEPETGIEGVITVGPAHGGPARMGVPDSRALANDIHRAKTKRNSDILYH